MASKTVFLLGDGSETRDRCCLFLKQMRSLGTPEEEGSREIEDRGWGGKWGTGGGEILSDTPRSKW